MNNVLKKWFWIGAMIGILNGLAGLLVGLTLMTETEKRKQGAAVIIWTILIFFLFLYINKWLSKDNAALIPLPITSLPWVLRLP